MEQNRNKKDKFGRPIHRPRGDPATQDEIVYSDLAGMAELAYIDQDRFIELTRRNKVKDFSKYVGFDLTKSSYIILDSGRQVHTTVDWNPLTFALVFEKTRLLDYILDEVNFNLPQLLAIGLPPVSVANYRDWNEDEMTDGQVNTLLMLVENRNNGFERILNKFHQFICDKLIKKLIPKIARTKFGPDAMEIMMQSHCFRGIFWEKVKNHGLFTMKGSFEQFF